MECPVDKSDLTAHTWLPPSGSMLMFITDQYRQYIFYLRGSSRTLNSVSAQLAVENSTRFYSTDSLSTRYNISPIWNLDRLFSLIFSTKTSWYHLADGRCKISPILLKINFQTDVIVTWCRACLYKDIQLRSVLFLRQLSASAVWQGFWRTALTVRACWWSIPKEFR